MHDKRGTDLVTVDPQPSTVLGNDIRNDGEPEAGAPGISCPTLVEPNEATEHSLSVGHRNSWTVVGDDERRHLHDGAIPAGGRGLGIPAQLD